MPTPVKLNWINKVSSQLSLKTLLTIPWILQIVGAVGVVGYFSWQSGTQIVNNLASQLMYGIGDRIYQHLENDLQVPLILNQMNADHLKLGLIAPQDGKILETYFRQQLQRFPSITEMAWGSETPYYIEVAKLPDQTFLKVSEWDTLKKGKRDWKTTLQGNRVEILQESLAYTPRQQPWYQTAVKAGQPIWNLVNNSSSSQQSLLSAFHPVYNTNQQLIGVLSTHLSLSKISAFLNSIRIGENGKSFIIDHQGNLIATSVTQIQSQELTTPNQASLAQDLSVNNQDKMIQAVATQLKKQFPDLSLIHEFQDFNFQVNNQRQFIQVIPFRAIQGIDWLIIIAVPESDFLTEIQQNTQRTLLLCLAALGLATVSVFLIIRWITNPIHRLNQVSRKLAEAQIDSIPDQDENLLTNKGIKIQELVSLSRNLDQIADLLKNTFEIIEEKVKERTQNYEDSIKKLLQKETQNQAILKAIPDLMFRMSADGVYLGYVKSQDFQDLVPPELNPEGKHIASFLPFDLVERQINAAREALSANTTTLYEQEIWLNNELHHEEIRVVASGEDEVLFMIRDISDRKRAEAALKQANAELITTLAELKATQNELIQAEKMAALGQLIAGVAHEINTPLGAIHSSVGNIARYLNQTLDSLPSLFQKLSLEETEKFLQLVHYSLEHPLLLSAKEERKLKRNLTKNLEDLNIPQAEHLAETLAIMGVYNDLQPFLGLLQKPESCELLEIAYKLSGLQRSTQTIKTATDRASKVVFALKSYAHQDQSGQMSQAIITDGIDTVLTLYHNTLKRGVDVIRDYANIPLIWCYPDELNQVWTNLIHNAIQAMDHKGILTISAVHQDQTVKVSFTDTGIGIPGEIQAKIFEPFFTTKPAGEGSGLGLHVVKKIIDKHRGQIQVVSQPGQTTFEVILPCGKPV